MQNTGCSSKSRSDSVGSLTILHRISSAPEPDRTSAFVARRHEMVVPVCIQLP
eukprot:COSAG06_NODE_2919_length_6095_cov_5.787191_3_plen_52_part_01